ncbi:hypothetical protein UB46_02690 [Burkholderiaceae bacterium 16]|nr:hypothetical protein UB46_02690 [Burkholderiaceae bacterium 16]
MNLLKALWWCPLSLLSTITVPSPEPGFEMHAAAAASAEPKDRVDRNRSAGGGAALRVPAK